jgi:hypothetical protein
MIEYIDAEVILPAPVNKQVWDGERFVPLKLYKIKGWPGVEKENWLLTSFGHAGIYRDGRFWHYSRAGNFTLMDEKVYTWYQLKWTGK